jgi:transglutaminase-like putative cysteine protease
MSPTGSCTGLLRRLSAAILLVALSSAAYTVDAFNYTVPITNFDRKIYTEPTSRFRLTSSDPDFTLIGTGYQSITSSSLVGGKRTIEIRTGTVQTVATTIGDRSAYLADTRFLNLSSPEITGAAAQLKGSADPVKATENFVSRHITGKDLGIPIIPADQVFRIRRGDCTEHSVLAVALLRKQGVPARAVVGMYCAASFLGKRDVFVYHMWVEAFFNGRWRLVDAANPNGKGPNRYIAFAGHSLKSETPLSYLRAISAIQDLSVTYLGD